MPESFGARLRQQREKLGIALTAITRQTGIKEALLEALERDDLANWPTGFYRRAFFRSYAAAIQLDPDLSLREFQAVHPEPPEVDVLQAMAAALGCGTRNGRSTALRGAVQSAFSSFSRFRRSNAADSSSAMPSGAGENAPPLDFGSHVAPDSAALTSAPPRSDAPPASVTAQVAEPACSGSSDRVEKSTKTDACLDRLAPASDPTPQPSTSGAAGGMNGGPDLLQLAHLCADLGCVTTIEETQALLREAAPMIDAAGMMVWAWNQRESWLEPVLWHGYAPRVVAQLPMVRPDEGNATAIALRTAQTQVVQEDPASKAAIAVPLLTASGCVGVFAVELWHGLTPTRTHVAVATLVAAQLAPIALYLAQPQELSFPQAVNGPAY